MPHLSLFAACDRVLLDPIADQLSLIGVSLRVYAQGEVAHQPDASDEVKKSKYVLPPLSVCAFWIAGEDDDEKKFEQKITVVASDSKETVACSPLLFTISRDTHRTVQPTVIACRSEGLYKLVIYLREEGAKSWGKPRGDFWFNVSPPPESRMSVTIKDEAAQAV